MAIVHMVTMLIIMIYVKLVFELINDVRWHDCVFCNKLCVT